MIHIDPTYLRTIYDGLLSGTLHKDNASSLPVGLVGIYEEALPPANQVKDRQKFLEFFSAWALLKKEVSIEFVASQLGWPEEQILDYLTRHSKWFNAPTSGKYVLYHERLRSFVLQKISHAHFVACNETIVKQGQDALEKRSGDEWEQYALRHLSTHLLIQAMETENADALKSLAYNAAHWNRQIEISKGFEWSKNMLNDMMLWASKYDDDEVIECALNKVDLYHLEQNDAPRIVELVANNDMDTALQRIEAFGDNNEEGLKRKFILYMLCLMELTLLDSIDKPFRKQVIEKLLKHLDENVPIDHSLLNWNDFFPSNLIFQMACVLAELGLDYLMLYKRTDVWETKWIGELETLDIFQLTILENLAEEINAEEYYKNVALELVCKLHANNLNFVKAIEITNRIDSRPIQNTGLWYTYGQMAARSDLKKTIELINKIEDNQEICLAYLEIISKLIEEGNNEFAEKLLLDADKWANAIEDECERGEVLARISTEYFKLGNQKQTNNFFGQACDIASAFDDEYDSDSLFKFIALQLCIQHDFNGAIQLVNKMSDESMIASAQKSISLQLAEHKKIEDAIALANAIEDDWDKSSAFSGIATVIANQGDIKRALEITQMIEEDSDLAVALKKIAIYCVKNNLLDKAMEIVSGIAEAREFSESIRDFASEWSKSLDFSQIQDLFFTELKYSTGKNSASLTDKMLGQLASWFAFNGDLTGFMEISMLVKSDVRRIYIYISGADSFYNLGKIEYVKEVIEQAYKTAINIDDIYDKAVTLINLSAEFAKYNIMVKSLKIMDDSIKISSEIDDEYWAGIVLKKIAIELVKKGDLNYAENIINKITEDSIRAEVMVEYAMILIKNSEVSRAEHLLEKAIKIATDLEFDTDRIPLLRMISVAYGRCGNINKSDAMINNFKAEFPRSACMAMLENVTSLLVLGRAEEAHELYEKTIQNANRIKDLKDRSYVFTDIVEYHLQLGNITKAQIFTSVIPRFEEKLRCWNQIAGAVMRKYSHQESLDYVSSLESTESKNLYLKSLAHSITSLDLTKKLMIQTSYYYKNDISSLYQLLLNYSLHELFFQAAPAEKIERFNRTLNIQWAIDIKNAIRNN